MPQAGPGPGPEQGLEAEAAGGLGAVQRHRAWLQGLHYHLDEFLETELRYPVNTLTILFRHSSFTLGLLIKA